MSLKTEWFEHDMADENTRPSGKVLDVSVPKELLADGVRIIGHDYKMDWHRKKIRFQIIYELARP